MGLNELSHLECLAQITLLVEVPLASSPVSLSSLIFHCPSSRCYFSSLGTGPASKPVPVLFIPRGHPFSLSPSHGPNSCCFHYSAKMPPPPGRLSSKDCASRQEQRQQFPPPAVCISHLHFSPPCRSTQKLPLGGDRVTKSPQGKAVGEANATPPASLVFSINIC